MNTRLLQTVTITIALAFAAGSAQAVSLTDLLAGGSITVGDKLFDDWQEIFQDTSDFHLVNTDNIDVTGINDGGDFGLQLSIQNGEFDVTGDSIYAYLDYSFGFHVSVLDPAAYEIKDNSLSINNAGLLNITADLGVFIQEDVFDAAGNLLGTSDVEFSQLAGVGGVTDLSDSITFDPQSEIWVTKNILVWATDPGETASLTGFNQRVSQQPVPEPATLLLIATGFAGLGLGRRRWRA